MRSKRRTGSPLPLCRWQASVCWRRRHGDQSLCEHRRNRRICASSNPCSRRHYTREERYGGIQCGLDRDAGADLHLADRIQPRSSCARPEDFNRFNTAPGIFVPNGSMTWRIHVNSGRRSFCDPQLGCSATGSSARICRRTCLAVEPGIPARVEFQRPAQFQRRRQLSALRDRRKLSMSSINIADRLIALASTIRSTAAARATFRQSRACERRADRAHLSRSPGLATFSRSVAPISIPIRSTSLNNNGHNYFLSREPLYCSIPMRASARPIISSAAI